MKHILNKRLYRGVQRAVLILVVVFSACTKSKCTKRELFLTSMMGEFRFVCVTLMCEQDTIIFCGEKSSLYLVMKPNADEQIFYQRCYESNTIPIMITPTQMKELDKNVFCLNNSTKHLLKQYDCYIDTLEQNLLDKLNNTPILLTKEDLLVIYLCWQHNVIFTTEDESGPYYWFTFEIQ